MVTHAVEACSRFLFIYTIITIGIRSVILFFMTPSHFSVRYTSINSALTQNTPVVKSSPLKTRAVKINEKTREREILLDFKGMHKQMQPSPSHTSNGFQCEFQLKNFNLGKVPR